jgi:hypothetical protein
MGAGYNSIHPALTIPVSLSMFTCGIAVGPMLQVTAHKHSPWYAPPCYSGSELNEFSKFSILDHVHTSREWMESF